jgi:apolipoprotein N-acyltransferase
MAAMKTHLIGPEGNILWTYQKAHPVPGSKSYKRGDGLAPRVRTPCGRLSSVTCYDADFPSMRVEADLMLVPGGDWPEMGQVHTLKMASLRAIENGYSLLCD